MSKSDVAKLLGVSERTVDRWRSMGRLKAVQIMRRGVVKFRPQTVEEFQRSFERAA